MKLWFYASSLTAQKNQSVVEVNSGSTISKIKAGDALILNGQFAEIKQPYATPHGNFIELVTPWPHDDAINQAALVLPLPAANFERAIVALDNATKHIDKNFAALQAMLSDGEPLTEAELLANPTAPAGYVYFNSLDGMTYKVRTALGMADDVNSVLSDLNNLIEKHSSENGAHNTNSISTLDGKTLTEYLNTEKTRVNSAFDEISKNTAQLQKIASTLEMVTAVKWNSDGGAQFNKPQGVYIKDGNGQSGHSNHVQYNVSTSIGDVFVDGGTFLFKLHLPLEKMNTIHRYMIAGGPATTSRCFHLSYYGGLNTNQDFRNHFEFNYKGSTGDRVTLRVPYKSGSGDVVLCVRKLADNSIDFSVIDTHTMQLEKSVNANIGNASISRMLQFSVGHCSTSFDINKTSLTAQSARFIGGLHSLFIYSNTLSDEGLMAIASGDEVKNHLGPNAQLARVFWHRLSHAQQVPVASGYTDMATDVVIHKQGDCCLPQSDVSRQGGRWILNAPISDGDVFAAPYKQKNPIIDIQGTCSPDIVAAKARLISPNAVSDWVACTVDNGVIKGEIVTTVQSDWLNIELAAADESVSHRQCKRVGAGVVVFAPNQSQFRIMSTSDSDVLNTSLMPGIKAAMLIDASKDFTGAWRHYIYNEETPIPDGIAAFFNHLAPKINAPILILNNAHSGTGVTQWLSDLDSNRRWSDTQTLMSKKRGRRISAISYCWHTNDQAYGANYGSLLDALHFNTGDDKSSNGHWFGEIFETGFATSIIPATRATDASNGPHDYDYGSAGENIHAVRKAQRAWAEQHDFAVAGPEMIDMAIRDGAWYGPHQDRDKMQGTFRLGERAAIGIARALNLDLSQDPSINQLSMDFTRTTITVTFNLPNFGSTLRTNSVKSEVVGFEISEDNGKTWTRSGFTAIIFEGEVRIEKLQGDFSLETQVRYAYGHPLSYGGALEPEALYDQLLYDGSDYSNGLGLPVRPLDATRVNNPVIA